MAREGGRLTALAVTRATERGYYADGRGLYLQVARGGTRSWVLRFRWQGGRREMGLGSLADVPLAEARRKAVEARVAIAGGVDPIAARDASRAAASVERAKAVTFKDAAGRYIEAHTSSWRNAKHGAQWTATLEAYAYPTIGKLPVSAVDVGHMTKVLEPIWSKKPETARRLRGRIEAVLDWAIARGYRKGDNPARWRGHLENLLPEYKRVAKTRHHPALPYTAVGAFVAELRKQEGTAARALEFLILTASRTAETIGARWSEIDLDKAEWRIPGDRIKAGKEHRVPLSPRAVAIVREMAEATIGEFVFPGGKAKKPLSNGAFLALLERMGRGDITAHGFRSTFRDWAAERTNYPRDVAEMALAHAIGDKVEAAYRRGDLFEKRRAMMVSWEKFCGVVSKPAAVISFRAQTNKG